MHAHFETCTALYEHWRRRCMNWFACTTKASIAENSAVSTIVKKSLSDDDVVVKDLVDKVVPEGMLNLLAVLGPKDLRITRHEAHTHEPHINTSSIKQ